MYYGTYFFQFPPWLGHCRPVLLHCLHVSLPNIPDAVPPLQAVHGCNVAPHFGQFIATILSYEFNWSGPFSSILPRSSASIGPCHDHPRDTDSG